MPIYFGRQKVSYQQKTGGVEIIPVPTPNTGKKTVNFYDYDGTLLHSYTREEALALAELPALPDRTSENLTCQGWNWTLENIKTELTDREDLNYLAVGANYITADGITYINITMADKYRSKMPLRFAGNVTIDWGDGNTQTVNHTSATTVTHNYAIAQSYPVKYTIKLTVNSGTLTLGGGSSSKYNICGGSNSSSSIKVYPSRIDSVFIGNGITSISNYAFFACYSLESITIPDSVTSIGNSAFYECYSLASATIPNSVTSIDTYAFYNCNSLTSVTIPNSVESIGTNVFQYCSALTSITIPSGVTSISEYTFRNCSSLTSITIPSGVTSIGNYAFGFCDSLASVTIPSGVTSIGASTFSYCYGIIKYDFSTHTSVPTLSNTNAFTGIASDTKIVVPDALYTEWKAATNWATYASKIVKVSAYVEP